MEHTKGVNDIQLNKTGQLFVTACKDSTSKVSIKMILRVCTVPLDVDNSTDS